jgi:hypothetical protein
MMEIAQLAGDKGIIDITDVVIIEFGARTDYDFHNIGIKIETLELIFDMSMPIEVHKQYVITLDNLIWAVLCEEAVTRDKGKHKTRTTYSFRRLINGT